MKVIGLTRVSTDEQGKEGVSLAAQRAKIKAYCKLYDLELVDVLEDSGQSAKSLKRPGLQTALAMLRSGEVAGLVITKLDRLSRNVSDWNTLIDGYFGEKAGKQLFSVTDSIDTRTAGGRLVLNVLMSVAQWEREAIGERTRDALQYMISQGKRCGSIRFGYDLAPDGETLIPNQQEQAAIKLMQDLRASGHSYPEIAAELMQRGILTKKGNKTWQAMTIRNLLIRAA